MIYDRKIDRDAVSTGVAWSVTVLAYAVAVTLFVADHWKVALLVAEIACGLSAFAAVRHLRWTAGAFACHLQGAFELGRDAGRLEAVPDQRIPRR